MSINLQAQHPWNEVTCAICFKVLDCFGDLFIHVSCPWKKAWIMMDPNVLMLHACHDLDERQSDPSAPGTLPEKMNPRHPKCCEDGLHHLAFLSMSVNFSEQKDIKDRWTSYLPPSQSNQSKMIQIHHGNTVFDVNVNVSCERSWEAGCPLTVHAARVWPAPLTQTIPVDRLSCGLGKPCLRGSKSFSPGSFSNINSLTTH